MKKKSFTLLELMVAFIILGILSTLGFTAYQGMLDDSKAKVCEKNLEALSVALDTYIMENDGIPAVTSQLPAKYIKNAYAQILKQDDAWKLKFAYFVIGLEKGNLAYAGDVLNKISAGNSNLLVCPCRGTEGNSYGINQAIAGGLNKDGRAIGLSRDDIKKLPLSTVLIGDCDGAWFEETDGLSGRHRRLGGERYVLGVDNVGIMGEIVGSQKGKIARCGKLKPRDKSKALKRLYNELGKDKKQLKELGRECSVSDASEVKKTMLNTRIEELEDAINALKQ